MILFDFRKTTAVPRLIDDDVIRQQVEQRQQEIAEYRAFRERVEQWREQDRLQRNQLKIQQIEKAEEMQVRMLTFLRKKLQKMKKKN